MQESKYHIELHIKLANSIPKNVTRFLYAVRTKSVNDTQAHWVEINEIKNARDIIQTSLSAYQKDGALIYTTTAIEEVSYYVTLLTVYNFDGTEIISNPSKARFDRQTTADIFWKVTKRIIWAGLKCSEQLTLSIEIKGNRLLEKIPCLALRACEPQQHLLSLNDVNAKPILDIPEEHISPPRKTVQRSYDIINGTSTVKQLKNMKLFLFETDALPKDHFTLRWAERFWGKIK
jgi:hypothetical protein